jgi:endo-1,4-beta-xylanase
MKNRIVLTTLSLTAVLLAVLLASCVTSPKSSGPPTLKSAFKKNFYVGVAVNRPTVLQASVQADNASRNTAQLAKDVALVKQQFNQIVPENDLKWEMIQPYEGPNGYDFTAADAFVNFGISNHMYLVGHTLVWHSQTPGWVFGVSNTPPPADWKPGQPAARGGRGGGGGFGRGGGGAPRATREQLLQRMHDHIMTVVGHYKGKIKVWDVVNEALSDGGTNILRDTSPWYQIIGPDFIAKAFEYAHEADPDAILRYNDYSLENPQKRQKLIKLIKSLQEQHVPVMAIGSQTHVRLGSPTFEQEDRALTEIESLGLPIHITELDVNNSQAGQRNTTADVASMSTMTGGGLVSDADKKLADEYATLFKVFMKHKSVKVVTFWGVNDSVTWLRGATPLLFDANDQPKPAFDTLIRLATEPAAPGK